MQIEQGHAVISWIWVDGKSDLRSFGNPHELPTTSTCLAPAQRSHTSQLHAIVVLEINAVGVKPMHSIEPPLVEADVHSPLSNFERLVTDHYASPTEETALFISLLLRPVNDHPCEGDVSLELPEKPPPNLLAIFPSVGISSTGKLFFPTFYPQFLTILNTTRATYHSNVYTNLQTRFLALLSVPTAPTPSASSAKLIQTFKDRYKPYISTHPFLLGLFKSLYLATHNPHATIHWHLDDAVFTQNATIGDMLGLDFMQEAVHLLKNVLGFVPGTLEDESNPDPPPTASLTIDSTSLRLWILAPAETYEIANMAFAAYPGRKLASGVHPTGRLTVLSGNGVASKESLWVTVRRWFGRIRLWLLVTFT